MGLAISCLVATANAASSLSEFRWKIVISPLLSHTKIRQTGLLPSAESVAKRGK
jgi:hypothetical protein